MANLSDLQLKNTQGDTKSNYSLIDDHADALVRISQKPFYLVPGEDLTLVPVDGGIYFLDSTDAQIFVNLPLSSDNVGMSVFVMAQTGGSIFLEAPEDGDTIDGSASSIEFLGSRDYMDLIATSANGWISKTKFLTPA